MRERHFLLLSNIGTFAKEDEAYELLNILTIALPLVAMVSWVADSLLAVVYLKWFHPWKIILQEEVSYFVFVYSYQLPFKETDQWKEMKETAHKKNYILDVNKTQVVSLSDKSWDVLNICWKMWKYPTFMICPSGLMPVEQKRSHKTYICSFWSIHQH